MKYCKIEKPQKNVPTDEFFAQYQCSTAQGMEDEGNSKLMT